jgi:hypothetical protein
MYESPIATIFMSASSRSAVPSVLAGTINTCVDDDQNQLMRTLHAVVAPAFGEGKDDLTALQVGLTEDGIAYGLRWSATISCWSALPEQEVVGDLWSAQPGDHRRNYQGLVSRTQRRHGNGAGASLFDRFVYGDVDRGRSFEEDFAEALEDLVLSMRDGRPHLRSPPGCTSPRSATRCS